MDKIPHPITDDAGFERTVQLFANVLDGVPKYAFCRCFDSTYAGPTDGHPARSAIDRFEKEGIQFKLPSFMPGSDASPKRVSLVSQTIPLITLNGFIKKKPTFKFNYKAEGRNGFDYESVAKKLRTSLLRTSPLQLKDTKLYFTTGNWPKPTPGLIFSLPAIANWESLLLRVLKLDECTNISVPIKVDPENLAKIFGSSKFTSTVASRGALLAEVHYQLRDTKPIFLTGEMPFLRTNPLDPPPSPYPYPTAYRAIGEQFIPMYVGYRPDATALADLHLYLSILTETNVGGLLYPGYEIW